MRGIYLLVIRLDRPVRTNVGSLGRISFTPGYYVYVGSAQNSLEARIRRHLRKKKKHHWHIDYLLDFGQIVKIIVYPGLGKSWESRVANLLARRYKPVPGFGSSDTDDVSHLFLLNG